jgi:hypothetical protein
MLGVMNCSQSVSDRELPRAANLQRPTHLGFLFYFIIFSLAGERRKAGIHSLTVDNLEEGPR